MPRSAREGERHFRRKPKKLSEPERQVVRDLWREHLAVRSQLIDVDRQLVDLMDRRDELLQKAAQTTTTALAEKMEVATSHIIYVVKPRDTHRA